MGVKIIMAFSTLEKLTLERILIYVLIVAVLLAFIFISYLLFSRVSQKVEVLTPNGGEEWEIIQSYKISWKSRGIDKVGIVLFEGKEPKWISQNIPANLGRYEWKIYPGQKYGDNYWVAVFEYPWQEGNEIDFSDGAFSIIYPELASCEGISVKNEWPLVPNDMPDLRRVFITEKDYQGNLGGLDGADRICQKEAEAMGFEGIWHAFLGGDSDDDLAVERLKRTARATDGIFVEAQAAATLIRGETCHRLLAKDFESFLAIFSDSLAINKEKLSPNFYENLDDIWLGRLDEESKKTCIEISGQTYVNLIEKYSLTATCQNWTKKDKLLKGSSLPSCYTSEGTVTQSSALGGLSSGIVRTNFSPYQGEYCETSQKLICIEE